MLNNIIFPTEKKDIEKFIENVNDFTIKNIDQFVDFSSRTNTYSEKNKMLIFAQTNGEATLVKPYKMWKKEINEDTKLPISVNKGSKAITIFTPKKTKYFYDKNENIKLLKDATDSEKKLINSGNIKLIESIKILPVGKVFDISQTDAPKSYHEKLLVKGMNLDLKKIYSATKVVSENNGIKLVTSNTLNNAVGRASAKIAGKVNFIDKKIHIDPSLKPSEKINVLFHELAHHYLHINDDFNKFEKSVKEIEAETTAYFLAKTFNIENENSKQYVQKYLNEVTNDKTIDLGSVIDRCLGAVNLIANDIKSNLDMKETKNLVTKNKM